MASSALCVKAQTTISASYSTMGMAPVAAFKIPHPATFLVFDATLLKTDRFSWGVTPDLGVNMSNGQLWLGDTWMYGAFKLDSAGRWVASAAMDWSLVGSSQADGSTKSVPYPTGRLRLKFFMDSKNTFDVEWWSTRAVPLQDGIKGNYISFQYTRTQQLGSAFAVSGFVNLFHLDYSDGTKGFARSFIGSLSHKSGVYVACQFTNDINATHVHAGHAFTLGITRRLK